MKIHHAVSEKSDNKLFFLKMLGITENKMSFRTTAPIFTIYFHYSIIIIFFITFLRNFGQKAYMCKTAFILISSYSIRMSKINTYQ